MQHHKTQFDVPTRPFLTMEELIELTGVSRPKEQERVLRENGVGFFRSANGTLRVSREILDPSSQRKKLQQPKFHLVPCCKKKKENRYG